MRRLSSSLPGTSKIAPGSAPVRQLSTTIKCRATAGREHHGHAIGPGVENMQIAARFERRRGRKANALTSSPAASSRAIGVSATDDGDHCSAEARFLRRATSNPPKPARPFGLDWTIEFGQFAIPAMHEIVHAGFAWLLEAAMLDRVIREAADHQSCW